MFITGFTDILTVDKVAVSMNSIIYFMSVKAVFFPGIALSGPVSFHEHMSSVL